MSEYGPEKRRELHERGVFRDAPFETFQALQTARDSAVRERDKYRAEAHLLTRERDAALALLRDARPFLGDEGEMWRHPEEFAQVRARIDELLEFPEYGRGDDE